MQKEKEIKAGVIALNVVSDEKFLEINGIRIERKEYKGNSVLTPWDISEIHKKEIRKINQQLKRNLEYFQENNDFFTLTREEFSKSQNVILEKMPPNLKEIKLFTERGYLKLTKTFTDEFSWKVQDVLIDEYFNMKKLRNALEKGEIEIVPKTSEKHQVSEYELKQQEINLINAENSRESIKLSKGQLLKSIADEISNERMKNTLLIHSANTAIGKEILLPEIVEKPSYDAAKIVEKLEQKYGISISTNMLGRIANEHHLKTAEYGYLAYDKAKSSIKQVESFRYYENAVDKFYEIISNDQKLKERYLK
jgi:toxin-antitoxin system, toxin component, bro family